jgi:hypothetical protein
VRHCALVLAACALLLVAAGCGVGGGPEATPQPSATPEGTTVTSDDGRLSLRIPLGAMPEGTDVRLTAVAPEELPAELQVLRGARGGYRMEPGGLRFSQPVVAVLSLDLAAVAEDEGTASAYALVSFSETDGLEVLPGQAAEAVPDEGRLNVRGEVSHLSFLGVTEGTMELRLERVAREQPVDGSFTAAAAARNLDARRAPLEAPEGVFGGSGKVSVRSRTQTFIAPEDAATLNSAAGWERSATFDCASDPGPGRYSVSMQAAGVIQGPRGEQIRVVLRLAIRYDVACGGAAGAPTDTPAPGGPTSTPAPGAAEVTVTLRAGCAHTVPGIESELQLAVTVRATGDDGAPLPRARVEAEAEGSGLIDLADIGTTDANGEARLTFRINQLGAYTITVLRIVLEDGSEAAIAEGTTLTTSFQVREECTAA